MRLLLIRHGETPANVIHALDTTLPGPGLTELGHAQAAALPAVLASERIEGIWASEAARAQATAGPLAAACSLPVQTLRGMYEIQAGALEKKTDPASITTYVEAMRSWSAGELDVRVPGGESGREALDRLDAGVRLVAATGIGTAAVFSHGAAIRVWSGRRGINLPADFVARNVLENTGIVALDGDPGGGWVVRSWMGRCFDGQPVDA
ncbi:histidine phosphatase family protein [Leekyejoonella antrihumi]|uniref:Histidine phosphatase family protein n=1 Tax=Leekyejoonella antrihumi TaxID=1660198 RepID=A0A563DVC6_9MICO|nr:histidine phosphatase family protein [Leekyejoonella antrihumi]TWP34217.1 histidine phosphatase family protein [Leekyejoonella antrihumi]